MMDAAGQGSNLPAGTGPSSGPSIGEPETPSGKGMNDENFPVGSFLLSAELRPHVAAFYAFARAADDIADNSDLTPEDKVARLNDFEAALRNEPGYGDSFAKAHVLRESLNEAGVTDKHARDILAAFRLDATKLRYANWQELLDYCELSANPVGRFLLDLHGESREAYPQSDALCTCLQILNHLQDCGDDYHSLNRVYIPDDWMTAQGTEVADLHENQLTAGMRIVINQMIDGVDELLNVAQILPPVLTDKRLSMESSVIVKLANRLAGRLRKQDPLAERVALSKLDFAISGLFGAAGGYFSSGRRSASEVAS